MVTHHDPKVFASFDDDEEMQLDIPSDDDGKEEVDEAEGDQGDWWNSKEYRASRKNARQARESSRSRAEAEGKQYGLTGDDEDHDEEDEDDDVAGMPF